VGSDQHRGQSLSPAAPVSAGEPVGAARGPDGGATWVGGLYFAAMARPRVELLWWRGCPSWERALAELGRALRERGLDPERVAITEILDEEGAAAADFPGSPTIRIDGADVQD